MTVATYADRHGREWAISLTVGDFPRLKAAGVDLGAVLRDGQALADLLFCDPERLGRAVWTLCETQAARAGVTPEQFADGLDGPALERLGEAMGEAIADFFPRSKVAAAIKGNVKASLEAADRAMVAALTSKLTAGGSPAPSASTPAPSP